MIPSWKLFALLLLVSVSSCSEPERSAASEGFNILLFPAAHITVPFAANRKGTVVVTNYHASRSTSFWFYLDLKYNENDPEARSRVQALAGSGGTYMGRRINNGVPIPVRLKVVSLDGGNEKVVFDKEISDEELESYGSGSYTKIISVIHLERGNYRVEIEALQDEPELDGISIDFDIHRPGNLVSSCFGINRKYVDATV